MKNEKVPKLKSTGSIMFTAKLFPTILIILDVLAAVMYVPSGDWRHVVYWLAAAILTFTVTY
jgi:hypothetical protein